jgi:hypothetical protein
MRQRNLEDVDLLALRQCEEKLQRPFKNWRLDVQSGRVREIPGRVREISGPVRGITWASDRRFHEG